jgi:hypothetical protein
MAIPINGIAPEVIREIMPRDHLSADLPPTPGFLSAFTCGHPRQDCLAFGDNAARLALRHRRCTAAESVDAPPPLNLPELIPSTVSRPPPSGWRISQAFPRMPNVGTVLATAPGVSRTQGHDPQANPPRAPRSPR